MYFFLINLFILTTKNIISRYLNLYTRNYNLSIAKYERTMKGKCLECNEEFCLQCKVKFHNGYSVLLFNLIFFFFDK